MFTALNVIDYRFAAVHHAKELAICHPAGTQRNFKLFSENTVYQKFWLLN